jgi:REP element-mobilizing transposase RayT
MSGLMKYHPHGSVLFVTFSIEEGLLLLCNPLCEVILRSCLARAQHLYPVRICHFLVEATHLHLILVVNNPAHVSAFIRHFKTESAHLINGVLGREKRTLWCEGYDSPVVLTPTRTVLAITYIYSNPAKDDLEDSIENYPGLSSWRMFQRGSHKRTWKWIRRSAVDALTRDCHNLRGYSKEASRLISEAKKEFEFRIEPNAWMEAFGIQDRAEQERINLTILKHLRVLEERARRKRQRKGKKVLGKARLLQQPLNTHHRPKRRGRRMWCLSDDRSLRIQFIQFFKDLMTRARRISQNFLLGDFSQDYPLGLYPPSLPKRAEPLAAW